MMSALPPWLGPTLASTLALRGHAVLLHASGAVGQLDLALHAARALVCESRREGLACGACAGCHLFTQRSHPDVILLIPDALREKLGWVEAETSEAKSKAKPSREIKVDAVRAAIDWAHRTASRAATKVLVIHPAEALNETSANALLKTLEEPPGTIKLLLTASDPEALLPTVRSRCQRIALAIPDDAQACAWLEGQGVAEARVLLAAAGGAPQGALALREEGIDAATWQRVPALAHAGHAAPLSSWPVARVVDALHKLCHDLMSCAVGAAPRYFPPAAIAPVLKPQALSLASLATWQRELVRSARHDEHPWHAALRIEALVSQSAALWQTTRAPAPARGRPLDTLPGR
jgi:DNA polymerase III subunit delta'